MTVETRGRINLSGTKESNWEYSTPCFNEIAGFSAELRTIIKNPSWHANSFLPNQTINYVEMISLEDFMRASFEKKCDVITEYSTYVAVRRSGNYKIFLYQMDTYFIEIYYSPTFKKVIWINAFKDVAGLLPYTDSISIADLGI